MRSPIRWFASLVLPCLIALPVAAQSGPAAADTVVADSARKIAKLAPIAVTATRSERQVFTTPSPMLVTDAAVVREESPNGIQDLFRNLPGVDVTGVGPNQGRLMIRGQRGQRILLLEDGVRLNNSRRQQDFGELPALTDINGVSRVEIVRGPASVLYGTDAIGGVVNQITQPPPGGANTVRGWLGYRYGSADEQNLVHGRLEGRTGKLGFALGAGYRDARTYNAPAGTFGQLTLAKETPVLDTGVLDQTLSADLRYDLSATQDLSLRVSRYDARNAGFGYVAPAALGAPNGATVRILYPDQDVTRASLAWRARGLGWAVADRASLTGWTSQNDRILDIDVRVPFGPPMPPTAGVHSYSRNVTDLASYGARFEAVKVLGAHVLTWGADLFEDRSENSDSARSVVTTFGPPRVRVSTTPNVPYAGYRSGGLFAQLDLAAFERLTVGAGLRGQLYRSWTRETPGLTGDTLVSETDATLVGSASARYRLTDDLNLMAVVGRAFRSPNLVERFFEGATPEGAGYQLASPELRPETSLNVDLGVKFRRDRVYAEAFVFRNTIHDGIRIAPAGFKVGTFDAFRNVNVEELRAEGIELLAEVQLGAGFAALGHYTTLRSKNLDSNNPVGDSYGSKLGGELAWRAPSGRFWAAYEVRHQGERDDVDIGTSPVGDVLPAFTVHNARAGVRLPAVGGTVTSLGIQVLNLTDRLYAEASNTSFFRPEPRRSAVMTVRLEF